MMGYGRMLHTLRGLGPVLGVLDGEGGVALVVSTSGKCDLIAGSASGNRQARCYSLALDQWPWHDLADGKPIVRQASPTITGSTSHYLPTTNGQHVTPSRSGHTSRHTVTGSTSTNVDDTPRHVATRHALSLTQTTYTNRTPITHDITQPPTVTNQLHTPDRASIFHGSSVLVCGVYFGA